MKEKGQWMRSISLSFRSALICAVAVTKTAFAASAVQSPADAKIAQVEQGLLPAVVLAGTPAQTRSLSAAMADMKIPGVSIAVIHGGRIAWAKGYGVTDKDGHAVSPDTLFQAGSISKSITAVAAMQLIEAGKLSPGRAVNDDLRSWKVPDNGFTTRAKVTLRGLLSHTAGINVHGFPGYASGAPVPTLREVLDGTPPANTPAIRVVSVPGTKWSYSGGGYTIVQQLIEDVTHQPFPTWLGDHVLGPAGMTHSTFTQPLPTSDLAKAAMPHEADATMVPGGPHIYPEMAAAGLWTTPSDLAQMMVDIQHALAGHAGGVLSPAMARRMLEPVTPDYSMGFDLGGAPDVGYFAKGGDTEGFGALMVAYRTSGDGAAVMANGAGGGALADEVIRSIAATYDWPDFKPVQRTAIALNPASLAHYTGTYQYRRDAQFTFSASNGMLMISSPGGNPERLYPASETEFFVLSRDMSYVFDRSDKSASTGHMSSGEDRIDFRRIAAGR
jgi:CubicO group peptidase (beta-lactamase class C family)